MNDEAGAKHSDERDARRGPGGRIATRALTVVGVLLLVFGAQVERAVRTAYDVDWTRAPGVGARLPERWEWLLALSGPAAILLLISAVYVWHRRERLTTLRPPAPDVLKTPRALGWLALVLAVAGAVCRFLAVTDHGSGLLTGASVLNIAALAAVVGYALVVGNLVYLKHGGIIRVFRGVFRRQRVNIAIVLVLTGALLFLGDTSGQSVDSIRSSPLVVGSGDVLSGDGAARFTLGLAASLMFALALYESGTLLVRTHWSSGSPGQAHILVPAVLLTAVGVLVFFPVRIGPGLLIAGVILFVLYLLERPDVSRTYAQPAVAPASPPPPLDPGRRAPNELVVERRPSHEATRAEANTPEWIAIVPLLALAATSVTATVEAALSDPEGWEHLNTLVTLAPAVLLSAFAILLTGCRPHDPHALTVLRLDLSRLWIPLTAVVLALTIGVFSFAVAVNRGEEWLLALYGLVWLVILSRYAYWLFHEGTTPSDALLIETEEDEEPRAAGSLGATATAAKRCAAWLQGRMRVPRQGWRGYPRRFVAYLGRALEYVVDSSVPFVLGPVALGGGIAVFAAVHVKPIEAGQLLGVFTLAFVALAYALPFLHVAVRATLKLRPPKLLWWFGINQVPVLTVLLLWWIAVGVAQMQFGKTETLHDVRLVDRRVPSEAESSGGHERVSAPPADLQRYFEVWLEAQEDIVDAGDDEPVPLVLVAAHGGGIRAAYWTVVALDCMLGYSADGVTEEQMERTDAANAEDLRAEACSSTRRTRQEQEAAAKRIFMASGVSGGAVGLYAYARQLIAEGSLGDSDAGEENWWVEERLANDFAAPAIGWALFHDVPNRLFGLHPKTAGRCGFELGGRCLEQDRAAVLEQTFDAEWGAQSESSLAQLRRIYDVRFGPDGDASRKAELVPLLAMSSTLTGGKARAVNSAADLGSWPLADAESLGTGDDTLPLAGTVEIRDALCETQDMRLSTAALLAARFPYVTPSGRIPGECASGGDPDAADSAAACADDDEDDSADCGGNYVDGGYTDNSGLFTIVSIWPSLRQLIVQHNIYAEQNGLRRIAPLIVELDNHYQKRTQPVVPSGGTTAETLVPPKTAIGGRSAIETFARAAAYRILPTSCTVTISPALHPGLIAPLGWELSEAARRDLRDGLTSPHPTDRTGNAVKNLLILQRRLSAPTRWDWGEKLENRGLENCLPREPCRPSPARPAASSEPEQVTLEQKRIKDCEAAERASKQLAHRIRRGRSVAE